MKVCKRAPDEYVLVASHLSCSGYFGEEKNLLFHAGNLNLICVCSTVQPNHCTDYVVLAAIVLGFCILCR